MASSPSENGISGESTAVDMEVEGRRSRAPTQEDILMANAEETKEESTPPVSQQEQKHEGSAAAAASASSSSSTTNNAAAAAAAAAGSDSGVPLSPSALVVEQQGQEEEELVVLTAMWGKRALTFTFCPADFETFTFNDLKMKIEAEVNIPIARQKLIGVTVGGKGNPTDADLLPLLQFKKKNQFMLIGTPADRSLVEPSEADLPPVVNDLGGAWGGNWDLDPLAGGQEQMRCELHLKRLQKAITKTNIHLIHDPRPAKKLLVLDLDYTLFDCKGPAESVEHLKRPYLEEFMTTVYEWFDLCVWSQTHWKWVEMKCTELGFLTNSNYRLSFVMDRSSMFTVSSRQKDGSQRQHEVKALEIIWSKFPVWGPHNTLHIDDLSRNFAMNPKNGVKVSSYRMAKRQTDIELVALARYLRKVATLEDVTSKDHRDWKDEVAKMG